MTKRQHLRLTLFRKEKPKKGKKCRNRKRWKKTRSRIQFVVSPTSSSYPPSLTAKCRAAGAVGPQFSPYSLPLTTSPDENRVVRMAGISYLFHYNVIQIAEYKKAKSLSFRVCQIQESKISRWKFQTLHCMLAAIFAAKSALEPALESQSKLIVKISTW